MSNARTRMTLVALCLALVTAVACGKGSPTSPSRNTAYSETLTGTVSAFGSTRHSLSIPKSGNLTLRLSWSDPVDLDLYLANAGCTSLYPRSNCGIVAQSDATGTSSETVARTVSAGEQFSIWVDNFSVSRSATYTLTLTIP